MRRGLCFCSSAYEKPSLSRAPGRKFSVSTSALFSIFRTSSFPSGRCRSTARLFLFRLNTGKKPAPAASRRRVLSPTSGSTLITSAPRSASTRPQEGPITMCANSTTRTPSSGSTKSFGQAGKRRVTVDRLARNAFHQELPCGEELRKIDSGRYTHALEHEHQVLGDHVAARAGSKRAATQAAHRAVEDAHTDLVGGERVREPQAARVVEMRRLELVPDLPFHEGEDTLHLRGIGVSDGIGERHAVAELRERLRDSRHFFLSDV